LVHEGLIAKTMLEMYDEEAIILEPAGALAVAGL
jgi:threonine dehydratase